MCVNEEVNDWKTKSHPFSPSVRIILMNNNNNKEKISRKHKLIK